MRAPVKRGGLAGKEGRNDRMNQSAQSQREPDAGSCNRETIFTCTYSSVSAGSPGSRQTGSLRRPQVSFCRRFLCSCHRQDWCAKRKPSYKYSLSVELQVRVCVPRFVSNPMMFRSCDSYGVHTAIIKSSNVPHPLLK